MDLASFLNPEQCEGLKIWLKPQYFSQPQIWPRMTKLFLVLTFTLQEDFSDLAFGIMISYRVIVECFSTFYLLNFLLVGNHRKLVNDFIRILSYLQHIWINCWSWHSLAFSCRILNIFESIVGDIHWLSNMMVYPVHQLIVLLNLHTSEIYWILQFLQTVSCWVGGSKSNPVFFLYNCDESI
jgi:hypothetical protein